MSDAPHSLTDSDLIRLYLSGYLSGAVTMLDATTDLDTDEAFDAASTVVDRLMSDPAARETILDLHRAGGGSAVLRPVVAGEGALMLFMKTVLSRPILWAKVAFGHPPLIAASAALIGWGAALIWVATTPRLTYPIVLALSLLLGLAGWALVHLYVEAGEHAWDTYRSKRGPA